MPWINNNAVLLVSSDNGDLMMATQDILVLLLPSLGSTNKSPLIDVLLMGSGSILLTKLP